MLAEDVAVGSGLVENVDVDSTVMLVVEVAEALDSLPVCKAEASTVAAVGGAAVVEDIVVIDGIVVGIVEVVEVVEVVGGGAVKLLSLFTLNATAMLA